MKKSPDHNWFYSKFVRWAIRLHLSRELVPYSKENDITREELLELLQWKMEQYLEEAWPNETVTRLPSPGRQTNRNLD